MADETEETTETAADVTEAAAPEAAPVDAAPTGSASAPAEAAPTESAPTESAAADAVAAETPAEPVAAAAPVASASAPAPAPKPAPAPAVAEDTEGPNRRKVREGVVVSDAMQATVVVAVVERVRHPRYGKTVQRTKKLYVHDAEDTAKVGDRVRVQETRPLSKLKRWRLTEVVERAR
jgi:small subunit ribosomal protein S17